MNTATATPASIRVSACLSHDGRYRYLLTRRWADGDLLTWIMLNPSTADANADDPTVRRCVGFARRWGYAGIAVANVFALRSPDPRLLSRHSDPVGPLNDEHLRRLVRASARIIAGWGAWPTATGRMRRLLGDLADESSLLSLGTTRAGHPRHPLYLPAVTEPQRWAPAGPSGPAGPERRTVSGGQPATGGRCCDCG